MSSKIKNQSKAKVKKEVEVICFTKLQLELKEVTALLNKILDKLCLDAVQLIKVKESLGSCPKVWKLEEAKEYLEVIIGNAALGNTQVLENDEWLVYVTNTKQ